ncbi:MAG: tetratricopeptide repeat protein [Nitrospinaceae bacterium]|jgi:protein O-GlcNAc transferase|nr:tetratricopeptide repeat protein [Nitrospinaceae bacterium]MBT3433015.1 tetratricopeptide repeat protein [Nitrospinaceae bacterium]MBT3822630.1 tetratricopeptide repeat protein [Nitrospinaceae bacterium]MBT4092837.1 tetratricopeptide repeat protein [Nitrospinaceae bacterium]MBT4432055.1 tetratricopeptide repeat protein [Nitrospinaceae bacterium]
MIADFLEWANKIADPLTGLGTLIGIGVFIWGILFGGFRQIRNWISPPKKTETDDPYVDKIVTKLIDVAGENRTLSSELTTQKRENESLKEAIVALTEQQDMPGVADALAHLEKGETAQAIQLFEETAQKKEAEGTTANKEAAEAYRHLGAIAFLSETQKALEAYKNVVRLDPNDPDGWNMLGALLLRLGKIDDAKNAIQTVMRLGEETEKKELIAVAYCNLGNIHETREELEDAEYYHLKALATFDQLCRKEGMAACYSNLGNIYLKQGHLDKAKDFCLKALTINKELGRKDGMAIQYGSLGLIHQTPGELEKAENYHLKALAIDEELGRMEGMADDYGNLGLIHRARGELDKAEEYQLKSLAIEKELGRKDGMAATYANLGIIENDRDNMEAACGHWAEALKLYQEVNIPDKISKYQNIMKAAGCENTPS